MKTIHPLVLDAAEAIRSGAQDAETAIEAVREALHPVTPDAPDPFEAAILAAAKAPEGDAERILREAERLPLPVLAEFRDVPIPDPILWRDPGADDGAFPDAVLSAGEVAILAAEGGTGKSTLTLALALAAANAAQDGANSGAAGGQRVRESAVSGAACGLRVRPGGAVIVGYEDSPARMAHRLGWIADAEDCSFPRRLLRIAQDPDPLFVADPEAPGRAAPGPHWPRLWDAVRAANPVLVVVDPVSLALADASVSEAGPVRAFMGALRREAERGGFGVLAVAHSTKAARAEKTSWATLATTGSSGGCAENARKRPSPPFSGVRAGPTSSGRPARSWGFSARPRRRRGGSGRNRQHGIRRGATFGSFGRRREKPLPCSRAAGPAVPGTGRRPGPRGPRARCACRVFPPGERDPARGPRPPRGSAPCGRLIGSPGITGGRRGLGGTHLCLVASVSRRRYQVALEIPAVIQGSRSSSSGVPRRRAAPDARPPWRPFALCCAAEFRRPRAACFWV